MKKVWILILVLTLTASLALVACNGKSAQKNLASEVSESMASVKTVTAQMQVTDEGVVVYEYTRVLTIYSEDSVTVATTTKRLDSNFAFVTETDSESYDSVDRSKLSGLDLSADNLGKVERNGSIATVTVPAAKAKAVLGDYDLDVKGDMQLIFEFDGKKLTKCSLNAWTEMNKNVIINVGYTY